MSFTNYMKAALDKGREFADGKAVCAEFDAYLQTRYPGWAPAGVGKPRVQGRFQEELAKAPREFEVVKGAAEAARHCALNLRGIERRYIDDLNLASIFEEGGQVFRYREAKPVIKDATWEHIFLGTDAGSGGNKTHTGLHWLGEFNANNHPSGKALAAITVNTQGTELPLNVFKATVTVWARPKASTFFPTAWTKADIRGLVKDAARYWIARGPEAAFKVQTNATVTWAGRVLRNDGAGAWRPMWIGGLGDPSTAAGMITAFPEFGGNFAA